MSSDEGSNGNKRKAEESAGGSPNKRVHFADALPPSGIIQDDQAQEDTNWIKYVQTEDEEVPKCAICSEEHSFNIKPTSYQKHMKDEHNEDCQIEGDKQNWIFSQFDRVLDKPHLECNDCHSPIEVEFEGDLVEHIKGHGMHAKQDGEPSQGSYRNAEVTVESRTSQLIDYLFYIYQNKSSTDPQFKEAQANTKQRIWSRVYWNISPESYKINKIKCKLCEKYFDVYLRLAYYNEHMKNYHKDEMKEALTSTNNKEWLEHFLFENYAMRCNLCNKYLPLSILDFFTPHLKLHEKEQGDDSVQNERSITIFLSKYIKDLIQKIRDTATNDAREKAWWMKYCEKVEEDRLFCRFRECSEKQKIPNLVHWNPNKIVRHVRNHLPGTEFGINANNWEHFLFENNTLKCNYCLEPHVYTLRTKFIRHLKDKHKINKSTYTHTEGGELSQETNSDAKTDELIKTLLEYLIKYINVC